MAATTKTIRTMQMWMIKNVKLKRSKRAQSSIRCRTTIKPTMKSNEFITFLLRDDWWHLILFKTFLFCLQYLVFFLFAEIRLANRIEMYVWILTFTAEMSIEEKHFFWWTYLTLTYAMRRMATFFRMYTAYVYQLAIQVPMKYVHCTNDHHYLNSLNSRRW